METLKEPPLKEAVVVPLNIPPGIPLLTTATGSVTAQPESANADANRYQAAHSYPPGRVVIIARCVGDLRQLCAPVVWPFRPRKSLGSAVGLEPK